jgi:hypothetical protein
MILIRRGGGGGWCMGTRTRKRLEVMVRIPRFLGICGVVESRIAVPYTGYVITGSALGQ